MRIPISCVYVNLYNATMDQVLCLTLVLCSVFCCQGLELSLNRDIPDTTGTRTVCGVLVCTENIKSLKSQNTSVLSAVSNNSILSLSVFKRAGITSREAVQIGSVTTQKPSFTRVANGIKVTGSLDPTQATLRLELVKIEDCQAKFSCHVRGVDGQGREAASVVSLVQQPRQRRKMEDLQDASLVPSLSLQLLTSLQQFITQSMERLEDKVGDVNKDLHKRIDALEKKMEDERGEMSKRIDSLESKIEDGMGEMSKDIREQMDTFERSMDGKFDLFENRVEDKIDNNNNLNKLIQLDVKVSTSLASFRDQVTKYIVGNLNNLTQEMQEGQAKALAVFSRNVEETLKKTSESLASMEDSFNLLKTNDHSNLLLVRNETARILDELAFQGNVCRMLRNDTIDMNTEILSNFTELEATKSVLWSSAESQLKDSFEKLTLKVSNEIKALKEIIVPNTCKKGMLPVTSLGYFYLMTYTKNGLNFLFLCDTVTDNGGWILIQRRVTGNINFDKSWADYKQGFGSVDGDFWLGNDKIHTITSNGVYELRVELRYQGKEAFAHYSIFSIADESDKYKLVIGKYNGTAGDSFNYHNGCYFTTADRDNDISTTGNCAKSHGGGWWFKECDFSNLNGRWGVHNDHGVEWYNFTGPDSASYTEMKIRQV